MSIPFTTSRFLIALSVLWAAAFAVHAEDAKDVQQLIAKNTQILVEKFYQEREYFYDDPERFYREMDSAMHIIVDFRRIAARVMGKFARKASKEEKRQFVEVFKRSLYETYSKTLIESGDFEIEVDDATLNKRNPSKATVNLKIKTDGGSTFPVVYSMYKTEDGRWLLENVIVLGVNIGLAFRDRFETTYRANRGNIQAVIENWNPEFDVPKELTSKS